MISNDHKQMCKTLVDTFDVVVDRLWLDIIGAGVVNWP